MKPRLERVDHQPPAAERDSRWRKRAACRDEDPELFYPLTAEQEQAALRICRHCPVRVPCGQFAVASGDDWGIWGGLTPAERRRSQTPGRAWPWTAAEDEQLRTLITHGLADSAIAKQVGRSQAAVKERRRLLGLRKQQRGAVYDPELVDRVRSLNAAGLTDGQIAERLTAFGLDATIGQVQYVRSVHGIRPAWRR